MYKPFRFFAYPFMIIMVIALCAGCQRQYLTARSEEINQEYLASCHVETPDPRSNGYCGQQVVVEWDLPDHISCLPDLKLVLSMITAKHKFETSTIPIKQSYGYFLYKNINARFMQNGAILTYKAEIYSGNQCIACWKQQGWVDWIEIAPPD